MQQASDTIAAIATPPGRGGVGVIRISGSAVPDLMQALLGKYLSPRKASLCKFLDESGEAIDYGIALYFRAPHSYTGEDVLELQGHGGMMVQRLLLERCLALGVRMADPGEFTRRAYLNDMIDLAQAESVADLIDASTRSAARSAVRSLQGDFSRRIQEAVSSLVELRMLVEAGLDFPEEDIEPASLDEARKRATSILKDILSIIEAARQGVILRAGIQIAIAGKPNAGKSSLLNLLSGDEVAIVTEIPGTTRDAIRQSIEIGGIPAHIVDTAGLRESEDPVEKIGMERARKVIGQSDLILYIADAASGLDEEDDRILAGLPDLPRLVVMNKIDLAGIDPVVDDRSGHHTVFMSAKQGRGLDLLKEELLAMLSWHSLGEDQFIARERHVNALQKASQSVSRALDTEAPEFMAEELREAQLALSSITGEFTPDDLLGEIFSRFCIGK